MSKPKAKRMATETKKETTAQKYKRLIEEAEKIKKDSHDELIAEINAKIGELRDLGYEYVLNASIDNIVGPAKKKRVTKPKAGAKLFTYNAALQCEKCGVAGHDGRAHKKHPEKFTAEELDGVKAKEAAAQA